MLCELCEGSSAVLKVLDEMDDECGVHMCWLCFKDNYLEEIANAEQKAHDSGLHIIREQLSRMDDFMAKTPDCKDDPLWWCDNMPAYPKEYTPKEWQAENRPVFLIWLDYLAELDHANLTAYHTLADKLNVADLLAASKEESEK